MTQGTVLNIAVGIAVCLVITTVLTDGRSEQTTIEKIVERLQEVEAKLSEQVEEIQSQKLLIEKQAKQIEELTKKFTEAIVDYTEKAGDSIVPPENSSKDGQFHNDMSNDTLVKNSGVYVTERDSRDGIRTSRQTQGMVAFTAYLSHDEEFATSGQILIFDKVITNEGGAYSQYSGIFTAPTDGVYMFIFHIGQRDVNQVFIDLVLNDQRLVGAVVEGTKLTQDLQGGNSVIIRLRKGDGVWARRRGGTHIEGGIYELTSISGFLMY